MWRTSCTLGISFINRGLLLFGKKPQTSEARYISYVKCFIYELSSSTVKANADPGETDLVNTSSIGKFPDGSLVGYEQIWGDFIYGRTPTGDKWSIGSNNLDEDLVITRLCHNQVSNSVHPQEEIWGTRWGKFYYRAELEAGFLP